MSLPGGASESHCRTLRSEVSDQRWRWAWFGLAVALGIGWLFQQRYELQRCGGYGCAVMNRYTGEVDLREYRQIRQERERRALAELESIADLDRALAKARAEDTAKGPDLLDSARALVRGKDPAQVFLDSLHTRTRYRSLTDSLLATPAPDDPYRRIDSLIAAP